MWLKSLQNLFYGILHHIMNLEIKLGRFLKNHVHIFGLVYYYLLTNENQTPLTRNFALTPEQG